MTQHIATSHAVDADAWALMTKTALLEAEDLRYLRMSADVLRDQVEAILDVWYGFVGANPHLLHYFARPSDGQPIEAYLAAVRKRFGDWILDTASGSYDDAWRAKQDEIGRRHHRIGKNKTDNVDAVDHIHLRYLLLLLYPIWATLKPFLAKKGNSSEDVEKMHQAWLKSLLLQIALWSRPYVKEADW
jgi:Protoglobin